MKNEIDHLEIHPFYGMRAEKAKGWRKVALNLFPLHILLPLVTELKLALTRIRSNRRIWGSGLKDLLVNVGCGGRGLEEWFNVDAFPAPGVNCLVDCRKRLPFEDGSVRAIYTEHFLEHLDYTEEVPYFLTECHRVLREGGVLRIVVPDLEKYVQAYCQSGWEKMAEVRDLTPDHYDRYSDCRFNTKAEVLNEVFRQAHTHKYAYDTETLEFLLTKYEFTRIVHQDFGQSLMEELNIDQVSRRSESLYIEAVK